jgi:predicted transcriptional regulator
MIQQLNKTFIFKYDPSSSFEKVLDNFQDATERKLKTVEPNVLRCNDLEILLSNMNKNRWEIFQALVNKKPNSLTELANLLHQDYFLVKKETEILTAIGIIELQQQNQEFKPIALYERIIFDLSAKEKAQRETPFLVN